MIVPRYIRIDDADVIAPYLDNDENVFYCEEEMCWFVEEDAWNSYSRRKN